MGFHSISEAQRRALVRAINAELSRTSDRQRLLQFARRSLYGHKQVIPRERELRAYIAKAIRQHEAALVREIIEAIDPELLAQWKITIPQQREDGAITRSVGLRLSGSTIARTTGFQYLATNTALPTLVTTVSPRSRIQGSTRPVTRIMASET